MERLAAKRAKVLVPATRIGALDASDAPRVVAAEDELLDHFGDALDAEPPVDDGVLSFVLIGQALKVLYQQTLEGVDSARPVTPRGSLRRAEGVAGFPHRI